MDLHERICRYLSKAPPAIDGQEGHTQTFKLACALYNGFALTEAQLYEYLVLYNARCQPPWEDKDLRRKVQQAVDAQHTKPRGHLVGSSTFSTPDYNYVSFEAKPKEERPAIDPAKNIQYGLKDFRCGEPELMDASPIKTTEDFTQDCSFLVQNLYLPGEKINIVTSYEMAKTKSGGEKAIPMGYGKTLTREEWVDVWELTGPDGTDAGGWMRMNPVDGGGIADKNITAYRFLLLEFDGIPLELQMSLLAKLELPIAAILTSGGKSIHAWVKVDCMDLTEYKDTATTVLNYLEPLGVDTKNKNPSRLSRLVGVTRKLQATGDGRQRLLYLNPNPQQRAIL